VHRDPAAGSLASEAPAFPANRVVGDGQDEQIELLVRGRGAPGEADRRVAGSSERISEGRSRPAETEDPDSEAARKGRFRSHFG
jgi:hypothetical protein